jgi:hypothetical protein
MTGDPAVGLERSKRRDPALLLKIMGPQQHPRPWHSCAGGGAVHSIRFGIRYTSAGCRVRPLIMSAAFSAIMIVGMLVLPLGSSGITEASTLHDAKTEIGKIRTETARQNSRVLIRKSGKL